MWFHTSSREYEDVGYLDEGFGNSLHAFYDEDMKLIVYYLDLNDPLAGPNGWDLARFEYGRDEMAELMKGIGAECSFEDGDPSCEELAAALAKRLEDQGYYNLRHDAWCHCRDWEY